VLRPQTRYVRTADGLTIASAVIGAGPLTTVLVPNLPSQIELAWEEPAFEQFMGRLAAFTRVILYDRRGSGLSDPVTSSDEQLALDRLALDVDALLDATDTAKAALIGVSLGSMTALRYAAERPARVAAVILIGASARVTKGDGYPLGLDPEAVGTHAAAIARAWGSGALVEADSEPMRSDPRYRAWAARLERHAYSPGVISEVLRVAATYDVRGVLRQVVAPILILHRTEDRLVDVRQAHFLAANLPNATYVELPGADHAFFLGDQQAMVDAMLRFLDDQVTGGELTAAARRAERKGAYAYGWQNLTPSERDVAILVAAGMSNPEIARRLGRSPHTIDGHLRRVFAKLDVNTRVGVAAEYVRVTV
jgi:pimeloyl-ACP methyl ester carboxylesterase/DNA-binding CsgD family transcriptional regulator